MPRAPIPKTELFARLARGHAAGITVVTPNRRLSQALMSEFDAFQTQKGLAVWEAPDILPFGAFVERLYEDALYSGEGGKLPLLLTAAQEQRLWEEILAKSGLLSVPQAAAQCRDAWRLKHAWRIPAVRGNEDANAFQQWCSLYERRTSGHVDSARLPDLVANHAARKPKLLVAYAFDILPPQTAEFLGRFDFQDCKPETRSGSAVRTAFTSQAEELVSAARWARGRLEAGAARIGVVVPDLQERRKEVVRVFSRVLQSAFNVSLGEPLDQYPVVALALSLLDLADREIPFETASRLLRSPFLAGAESEMAARARLDARLRKKLGAAVSLPKLIAGAGDAPLLRKALEGLFAAAKEDLFTDKSPSGWARRFTALLAAAGYPGERALDPAEFQARAKLNELLAELAKLQWVTKQLSFSQALQIVKGMCAETLFQPESPDAPVQVLGIFEATGMAFDHLWVSGLIDEKWPLAARPNPFLPIAAQKKAGIPQASAEGSLALDRRLTEEWKASAPEVVFSWFAKEKDRDLAPSPLIVDLEISKLEIPAYPRHQDLIFSFKQLNTVDDAAGPSVAVKQVKGGTRVLADQSACPFRAFARWRLAAQPLEEPAPGLDARERGSLLHALMKHLWGLLKNSSSLRQNVDPVIAAAAAAAVKEFGLEGRFAELERARLARLAREWLALEAKRPPFDVSSLEEQRILKVAGLEFSGRIDRMDRIAGGAHVLIDYKGARTVTTKHWEGPRPHDPQLPLYASAAPEEIAAVAFAKLRRGDLRWVGLAKAKNLLPGVKAVDWKPLLQSWKQETEALGAAFAAGEARVDPKKGPQTCRNCDLHTLCRVYEKLNFLEEPEWEDYE